MAVAHLLQNGTNPLTIDEFDAFVEEIKALEKLQTSDAGPSVAYEDFLAAAMEAAKAKGKKGKKK